jgi:hypothetical protein
MSHQSDLDVVCPDCNAPAGVRCVDLERFPYGWRAGAPGLVFAHKRRHVRALPEFATLDGESLHRLSCVELDGAYRSRCGIVRSHYKAWIVTAGDTTRQRLTRCRNCDRIDRIASVAL